MTEKEKEKNIKSQNADAEEKASKSEEEQNEEKEEEKKEEEPKEEKDREEDPKEEEEKDREEEEWKNEFKLLVDKYKMIVEEFNAAEKRIALLEEKINDREIDDGIEKEVPEELKDFARAVKSKVSGFEEMKQMFPQLFKIKSDWSEEKTKKEDKE